MKLKNIFLFFFFVWNDNVQCVTSLWVPLLQHPFCVAAHVCSPRQQPPPAPPPPTGGAAAPAVPVVPPLQLKLAVPAVTVPDLKSPPSSGRASQPSSARAKPKAVDQGPPPAGPGWGCPVFFPFIYLKMGGFSFQKSPLSGPFESVGSSIVHVLRAWG